MPDFACLLDQWLAFEAGAQNAAELPKCVAACQEKLWTSLLKTVKSKNRFYAQSLKGQELPLLSAADLVPYTKLLCLPLGEVERIVTQTTSGTMGPPKRIAFSEEDLARTCTFFALGLRYLVKKGQRVAVCLPGGGRPNGVCDLLKRALTPLKCEVIWPQTKLAPCDLLTWLKKIKPHVLISSPQTLALLLEICPYGFHELEGVLSSADYLDPQLAQKIQTKWHCQLLNHYGLTEVCFGCAVECPAHHGMHLRALDLRLEIIDPQSKQPVPMGQVGEIVITTLRHTAMPLIRYRTGDIASLLPGPCACGSPLPRLGEVLGRLEPASGQIVHQAKGGASCLPL